VVEPGLAKQQAQHWSGDGSADDRDRQVLVEAGTWRPVTQREVDRRSGRLGGGDLCGGVHPVLRRFGPCRRGLVRPGAGRKGLEGRARGGWLLAQPAVVKQGSVQAAVAPLQFLCGGDRSVQHPPLVGRPGLEGRLRCRTQLPDLLFRLAKPLGESGQELLSLGNPVLQVGAPFPVAWPPPRSGLRQLSPQALQHELFLVAVGPGTVDAGLCDRELQLQRALGLRLRLFHPTEQVVDAGAPHLLGQPGQERA
jgi:hypothetical protein